MEISPENILGEGMRIKMHMLGYGKERNFSFVNVISEGTVSCWILTKLPANTGMFAALLYEVNTRALLHWQKMR